MKITIRKYRQKMQSDTGQKLIRKENYFRNNIKALAWSKYNF